MRISITTIVIIILVIALGITIFRHPASYMPTVYTSTSTISTSAPTGSKASMVPYSNVEGALSFEYPSNLYIKEVKGGEKNPPKLALVLVQNTQENRDLLDGKITEPREGPTSITIDVYDNKTKLDAKAWVTKSTNWVIANSATTTVTVAGMSGFSYTWSGLYEGESVVLAKGDKAYVFSMTWLDPNDQIVRDFDMILNSLVI